MKKSYYLEPSNCITRLLTIITVLISLQTISMTIIIYGIYTVYDNHRHDLKALGSVPWGEMARQISEQYMSMDKNAINNIITNSNNLTQKANLLVHTKGDKMADNFHTLSLKTLSNMDLFDITRTLLIDLKNPIHEINGLLNKDNTANIKDIIDLLRSLTGKLDDIQLNELIKTVTDLAQKLMKDLSPETMAQITSIVQKVDSLINEENTKLIHDLADDADHTVQSVNKLFSIFDKNKK